MSRFRKYKNQSLATALCLVVLLLCLPVLSYADYHGDSGLSEKSLTDVLAVNLLEGVRVSDAPAIRAFYAARENHPFWLGYDSSQRKIKDTLSVLKDSWTHGLNPDTYHATEIESLIKAPHLSKKNRVRLELLLTDGAMHYGRDVTGMRVDPAAVRQKAEFWRQPMAGEKVMAAVSQAKNPAQALAGLAPHTKIYNALRSELLRLANERNDYERFLPIDFKLTMFRPGERHREVPALRGRMGLIYNPENGPENFYDDQLAAAVMKFQKQHGLDADGIIGSKTLALLNRTNRGQMEQIVANLERLRWMDQELPERYIVVNIPSQTLWAIEKDRIVHKMPVVVGMPVRQTRDFKTEITGIRFNPTWTVPTGIKQADMLPKLKENPLALVEKGIELFRGHGRNAPTIDPESVNWNNISRAELNHINMVQVPGDHNALGRVRVLMQNEFDIYLHDTNHPELFDKDDRTASSGCIRLSQPRKIASFVLSRNKGWTDAEMDYLIETGKTVEVPAEQKLPVYIVYQSIWMDDREQLVYGSDVYKRDRKLIEVLGAMNGFWLPQSDRGEERTVSLPSQLKVASAQ